jgi:capsular exopolysaccharide synthesis family protein
MSLIFDALQRSEGERSGVDLSTVSTATELLQLIEHQVASNSRFTTQHKSSDSPGKTDQTTRIPLDQTQPIAGTGKAAVDKELSLSDRHLKQFSQFQSLHVDSSPLNTLVCLTDKDSLAAEKFRFLAVRLRQLRRERLLQKVLITSTIPHEGKSTVAANIACALARKSQRRTLLLEGDLRQPYLSKLFGLSPLPGICEWLQGTQSEVTNIYRLEGADLWIFPAGTTTSNPLELLQSARFAVLMDQVTTLFDWIIIDSPPVLPLADTSVWSRIAEGILLVTRQGTTEKRQLQRGLEAIDQKKVVGALMNCARHSARGDNYYPYHPTTS